MKVKDLMDILGEYDPEMEVHTSYNYGDHWRTQVAPSVGEVFEGLVVYSEYHRMPKLVEDDEGDEDEEPTGLQRVLIIG